MPIIQDIQLYDNRNVGDKKPTPHHYYWPLRWRNFTNYPYLTEWVREYRRQSVKDQELFISWHKEYKGKFFKEEARYHLRLQRACTLILGYLGEGEYRPCVRWPLELAPELDEITYRIELREADEEAEEDEPNLVFLKERRKAISQIRNNGGAVR